MNCNRPCWLYESGISRGCGRGGEGKGEEGRGKREGEKGGGGLNGMLFVVN